MKKRVGSSTHFNSKIRLKVTSPVLSLFHRLDIALLIFLSKFLFLFSKFSKIGEKLS